MEKKGFEKIIKENIPDLKFFTRRHISETLTVAAVILGGLSAWRNLFFGGIGLSIAFLVIGMTLGIFFPVQVDGVLRKLYQLAQKKDRTSEIVVGTVSVVIAILFPFIYFGLVGTLAGSSYHYFTRQAQHSSSKDKAA